MSDNNYTTKRDYKEQFAKKAETAFRRASSMSLKVFTLKIQINKCDLNQLHYLKDIFLEAKWYYNDCIAFGNIEGNKPWKNSYKKTSVIHYDKDKNPIESEFKVLSGGAKQEIIKRIGSSYKSIKTNLKNKNIKTTHGLNFKSEFNSVPFRQYNNSWKFKGTKIKLEKCSKPFKVNGLEQLQIDGIEFANLNLIQKASGYYLQITCYVPKKQSKEKSEKSYQTLGIDFGCETTLTGYIEETNESFKLNFNFEQSEKEKRLQRRISKHHSKNFSNKSNKGLRLQKQYRKKSEHRINQKNDKTNKLVCSLKQFEIIVIQDEMLSHWQKSGHGKKIYNGILGRLKSKLKTLPNVFVLDKSYPTSKFCFDCFHKNDDLRVWNRTFICPNCGIIMDRDVHAAKNMISFYKLLMMVPTEIHREPKRLKSFVLDLLSDIEKRVEINPSVSNESIILSCIQELSEKHEATDHSRCVVVHNESLDQTQLGV